MKLAYNADTARAVFCTLKMYTTMVAYMTTTWRITGRMPNEKRTIILSLYDFRKNDTRRRRK